MTADEQADWEAKITAAAAELTEVIDNARVGGKYGPPPPPPFVPPYRRPIGPLLPPRPAAGTPLWLPVAQLPADDVDPDEPPDDLDDWT